MNLSRTRPKQAMQQIAGHAAIYPMCLCHPPFGCVARFIRFAVADLCVSLGLLRCAHHRVVCELSDPWLLICSGREAPLQNEHENFAVVTRALFLRRGVAPWK